MTPDALHNVLAHLNPPEVPYADQLAELERELLYRRHAYKKWVSEGKMDRDKAREHYRRMKAAVATLRQLAEAESGQGRLL